MKFRIVPMTWITGVDFGMTFVLTSESGGNFAGAWAQERGQRTRVRASGNGAGIETRIVDPAEVESCKRYLRSRAAKV